jgi:hypothetical protein
MRLVIVLLHRDEQATSGTSIKSPKDGITDETNPTIIRIRSITNLNFYVKHVFTWHRDIYNICVLAKASLSHYHLRT